MLMHFRIKHFDRYVGIFVILALAVILGTLVSVARGQKWFEKRYHYKTVFNKVQGLKPGTAITISGMEVGDVKSLRLTPQSKVELTLEILKTYKDYLRKDSQVTIASSLIGNKTVELLTGSPDQPPLAEGAVIPSVEPKELTDMLKDIDVKEPLKKVDATLENLKSITTKLNSPEGDLFKLLRNVEFVTSQLKNGEGNVGAILQDKKIHQDINLAIESLRRVLANLEETSQNAAKVSKDLPKLMVEVDRSVKEVPKIIEDVKKTTSDLPRVMEDVKKATANAPQITENVKDITKDVKVITGNVKQASPEIPNLMSTTQESMEEAEKLIQGLQNHWLLRGSMPKGREDTPIEISQRETPYTKKGEATP
jgi:phospholipid/cholesterol/gamma-HCH transport system substrate-binding protein